MLILRKMGHFALSHPLVRPSAKLRRKTAFFFCGALFTRGSAPQPPCKEHLFHVAVLNGFDQTAVLNDVLDKGRERLCFETCTRRAVVNHTVV